MTAPPDERPGQRTARLRHTVAPPRAPNSDRCSTEAPALTSRRLWQRAACEAELCQAIEQAALSYSAHQLTAMRRAARAPRQDWLSWPLQVCAAYRQAVQREIADGRIVCDPPDSQFLLDRWLPSRTAELAELLDWLVWEAGAAPALQLVLTHLRPAAARQILAGER